MRAPYGTLEIEREGSAYSGAWRTEDGLITVRLPGMPPKTTQLGESADDPEALARIILAELVTEMLMKKRQSLD